MILPSVVNTVEFVRTDKVMQRKTGTLEIAACDGADFFILLCTHPCYELSHVYHLNTDLVLEHVDRFSDQYRSSALTVSTIPSHDDNDSSSCSTFYSAWD